MKHTEGPWKVQQSDSSSYAHTIMGNGFWIADIAHGAIRDDDIANARLIAAAPEMEARLQQALRYLEHPDVQAIPFSMPVSVIAEQITALLAKINGGNSHDS